MGIRCSVGGNKRTFADLRSWKTQQPVKMLTLKRSLLHSRWSTLKAVMRADKTGKSFGSVQFANEYKERVLGYPETSWSGNIP